MALIYTDEDLVEQGYLSGVSIDIQEEDIENSITLTMGLDNYEKLSKGCYVYDEDNPQFGGRLQKVRIQTDTNILTWEGLTFAGILSTKIIQPPSGHSNYEIVGKTFEQKVKEILEITGLDTVFFTAVEGGSTETWTIDRYTDALSALRKLASDNGHTMIVTFDKVSKMLEISFGTAKTIESGDEFDSDLFEFDITKDLIPVNHLICLGSGKLENRHVYHLYADEEGNISETQTITGANEIDEVFDYSNAESYEELKKAGLKRFKEIQNNGTKLEIMPPKEVELHIGDVIIGKERKSGIEVAKQIKKVIYKAQEGLIPSITYETTETKGN